MTHPFPQTPDFVGFNEPVRIEGEIFDLIVEGGIPQEIAGTWFRSIADPQFPPMLGNDTYLSGDGMVSAFRFQNGRVDFQVRYVKTERFLKEREARRALFGRYRNPYTNDPSVEGVDGGVANTTPIFHGGKLLALKEDSHAVELNPLTLETVGRWTYNGKLKSQTMTAHPRLDPDTGDLYFFGYEAGGLATTDIAYCRADKSGNLVSEQWFKVPYCSMMHDFAVTKEHAIFPVFPTICDLETLKQGGSHWQWDSSKNTYVGIMPRDGDVKDMRWFEGPPVHSYHIMNAFNEGSMVHLDLCVADFNVFPFVQEASGGRRDIRESNGRLARWSFDLGSDNNTWVETQLGPNGEMPRVADKDLMKPYHIGYYANYFPECGPPHTSGPTEIGFNTLSRIDLNTGELKSFSVPTACLQEPVHIKSAQPGHEGYLMAVVENERSEVLIFNAATPDEGPLATIKLPLRLRSAVHGNWVPDSVLPLA